MAKQETKQDTKWVAFKRANTVPAEVLGRAEAKRMQPGEPVELPKNYAEHVVGEGFAEIVDPPKAES